MRQKNIGRSILNCSKELKSQGQKRAKIALWFHLTTVRNRQSHNASDLLNWSSKFTGFSDHGFKFLENKKRSHEAWINSESQAILNNFRFKESAES